MKRDETSLLPPGLTEETPEERSARETKEHAERERKVDLGTVDNTDASILSKIRELTARNNEIHDQMAQMKQEWRTNEQGIDKLRFHLHGGSDPSPYLKIAGIDYAREEQG